jgi:hypothetical protein
MKCLTKGSYSQRFVHDAVSNHQGLEIYKIIWLKYTQSDKMAWKTKQRENVKQGKTPVVG